MLEFIVQFTDKAAAEKFDRYHGTNGELVRCRDCKYWRREVTATEHWVCAHHSFNERKMYTTPDFYCADGERRDSE